MRGILSKSVSVAIIQCLELMHGVAERKPMLNPFSLQHRHFTAAARTGRVPIMKVLSIILLCLLTTACASSAKVTDSSSNDDDNAATTDKVGDTWFCQVGESEGAWDCVQDDALAAKPTPTRLPTRAERRLPVLAKQEIPYPKTTKPAAASVSASSAAPRSAPQSRGSDEANLPPHIALSYRPDKPVAILDLPAEFYAVQLVAVSTKGNLEDFASKHKIQGMSAARVWNGDQLFYVLLLGIYETRTNAEAAISSLAPPFDKMKPWVRSLDSLQQSMLQADKVAGTSEI